ncbi:MAG: dienelactone hydrolase family protein [Dehalococcoidia bacterium]|nr:dienelactone hydrolase family protein [Dehalococcoidia bacterium]
MDGRRLRIDVPAVGAVTAVRTRAARPRWLFIYAPGAGAGIDDGFGAFLAARLPEAGVTLVRFQFPYREAGRRAPDRPPLLEATWRAVIAAASEPGMKLCIGGRSMGGRIASQVVGQGERVDALALFAYPLHPPGRPAQRRDAHLPSVRARTLLCSGTRDAFASPEELTAVAGTMPRARVHLLEDVDHGFAVARSSGRTRDDVWREASDAFLRWLRP